MTTGNPRDWRCRTCGQSIGYQLRPRVWRIIGVLAAGTACGLVAGVVIGRWTR